MDELEERVQKFNSLSLPGQPMGMHMGTSYLVNDLWNEVKRLRKLDSGSISFTCPKCNTFVGIDYSKSIDEQHNSKIPTRK